VRLIIKGRVWKFGDNISTDHIIPGRYFYLRGNINELAKHTFEDIRPDFVKKVKPNDIVVGGYNFGMGSSREHAVLVLKVLGIGAIIARSFARIFYRNAFNLGIPAIIADTTDINEGETLEIHLDKGVVISTTRDVVIRFNPIPPIMMKILKEGGIIRYVLKYNDLPSR